MKKTVSAIAAAACFWAFSASASPIQTLTGLTSITFYERTTSLFTHTINASSAQILQRRADPLIFTGNADFWGTSEELYDVFYSDADGSLNTLGAYITVEAIFNNAAGGGLNLSEVQLNFSGGGTEFANVVSSHVAIGAVGTQSFPSLVNNAVDGDLNTHTAQGTTIGTADRLRVTVGFASSVTAVPEPGTFIILGLGLAGFGYARRKRAA